MYMYILHLSYLGHPVAIQDIAANVQDFLGISHIMSLQASTEYDMFISTMYMCMCMYCMSACLGYPGTIHGNSGHYYKCPGLSQCILGCPICPSRLVLRMYNHVTQLMGHPGMICANTGYH